MTPPRPPLDDAAHLGDSWLPAGMLAGSPTAHLPGLVPFLFGLCGDDPQQEVPGPALVRLLCDCGLTVAAARSLLARQRSSGRLTSRRSGRVAHYRLAAPVAAAFARSGGLAHGGAAEEWNGEFHGVLYSVPERDREFRDRVRRLARFGGYGHLRAGLMIGVRDAWDRIRPALGTPPPGARVSPVRMRFADEDAPGVAAEAWDLSGLAETMQALAVRLTAAGTTGIPSDGDLVRECASVVRPVYQLFVTDPGLPRALLPCPWPRDDLMAAMVAYLSLREAKLDHYVASLLDR